MSSGMRHVATDPVPLASKRERRRGAAGRAAALRRAPSDSDCSGETASLSADSADRAPRPPPVPSRGAKSRSSRRRGSEWEVLEGLKDGQRFDKRPEVFNGYLHKKRKWPLKGWHKRFFVIDAGILVYARSPSDVARGRLHGSVDVGLSVISAKQRRRRIDIDADEFIYHLRAKTPDVFRTWLLVLKTHRLYRQHLLTFGARDSRPKIHPPLLEDLPPTDASSRPLSSTTSFTSLTSAENLPPQDTSDVTSLNTTFLMKTAILDVLSKKPSQRLSKFKVIKMAARKEVLKQCPERMSLCSMHCLRRFVKTNLEKERKKDKVVNDENKKPDDVTTNEIQIHTSELDVNQHNKINSVACNPIYQINLQNERINSENEFVIETAPTFFCFNRKNIKRPKSPPRPNMKRSQKCTNVIKYKNKNVEPGLNNNRCALLGKYKLKTSNKVETKSIELKRHMQVDGQDSSFVAKVSLKRKEEQDITERAAITNSDYERITRKLLGVGLCDEREIKTFVSETVRKLQQGNIEESHTHPVKQLFQGLLEYWLKNSEIVMNKTAKTVKSINKPSNQYFTNDAQTSCILDKSKSKGTQFHGISNQPTIVVQKKPIAKPRFIKQDSSEKDRRIQELETLLRSTVYLCETHQDILKQKDIKLTKTLISNLRERTTESENSSKQNSSGTSETPQIKNTLDNLINDTSLPSNVAKEFLSAYLDLLMSLSERSSFLIDTETSPSSQDTRSGSNQGVELKEIDQKVSKSVMVICEHNGAILCHITNSEAEIAKADLEQTYIKNMLYKMSTKLINKQAYSDGREEDNNWKESKDNLETQEIIEKNIPNNKIDLSNYNIVDVRIKKEHEKKGVILLTITLSEKNADLNDNYIKTETKTSNTNGYSLSKPYNFKEECIVLTNIPFFTSKEYLKPYQSNEEMTKCGYCNNHSYQSLGLSFGSSNFNRDSEIKEHQKVINNNPCCSGNVLKTVAPYSVTNKSDVSTTTDDDINDIIDSPQFKIFEKAPQTCIDENFILLLLENLTLLSKGLPSLHKDINGLFQKLKKKYDKVSRQISNQGLGLLGKIYPNNVKVSTENTETQCDIPTCQSVAVATSKIKLQQTIKYEFGQSVNENAIIFAVKYQDNKELGLEVLHTSMVIIGTDENLATAISEQAAIIQTCLRKITTQDSSNESGELNKCMKANKSRHNVADELSDEANRNKSLERHFKVYQVMVKPNHEPITSNSRCKLSESDDMKTIYRCNSEPSFCSGLVSPSSPTLRGPQAGFVTGTPGGTLAGWIIESGGPLESASKELGQAQLSVQQLQRLLDALELQQQAHHDTDVSLDGASPSVKKDRRKFGLRKKKSSGKCMSVDLAPPPPYSEASMSHMAISTLTAPPSPGGNASSVPSSAASLPIACAAARPQSLPGAESLAGGGGPASLTSLTPDHQLREDFTVLAKDLVSSLKGIVGTLVCERGRLRAAMDAAADTTSAPSGAVVAALRTNLSTAMHQNSELRSRLSRIHDASDLAEISSMGHNSDPVRACAQSLSYSSSCVSASEFFDAEEHDDEDDMKPEADEAGVIELDGDSTSEVGSLSSEEGSASGSDNSDVLSTSPVTLRAGGGGDGAAAGWARRQLLPSPRPTPGGPSLWNLLRKNIGKDLSSVSMPVTINEPLNILQRLCEELEYSELLDAAAECKDPIERMALIAAFAVSAYASSMHRAASKPFNPLLGETYECVRDDRNFKFIAEQVCHHPPVSACHAESPRWCFWQEARIKTKFWGKSMEFQPAGSVHVRLKTTQDHYSWNKVTTCVHNLFAGQRYVDIYGDMHITCHGTGITCKLQFVKASSWSSVKHGIVGAISGGCGARLRLQGRWSEALHCGEPPRDRQLWRPGAMPPEHELYYGFTRFAMELNEMEPGMKDHLPPTDTRLRPDQRALEEGNVEAAEHYKHQLEQAQRDRRRDYPEHRPRWFRKAMEGNEEMWLYGGEYWKARAAGFPDDLPRIW